jgi:hypothetical protein
MILSGVKEYNDLVVRQMYWLDDQRRIRGCALIDIRAKG